MLFLDKMTPVYEWVDVLRNGPGVWLVMFGVRFIFSFAKTILNPSHSTFTPSLCSEGKSALKHTVKHSH